jgi:biotin carboxyl carrier protein
MEIGGARRGAPVVKTNILAGGRAHGVEVRRAGKKFLVTVNGHQHEVDVSEINGALSLLIGDRSYEVTVGPGVVHVGGVPVEVGIARPTGRRGDSATHDHTGPQKVAAPMPGKIVKVLVKAGDRVEPRQGLVVVEAMKMENELRSRAAGTVTEVRAIEGSSVEAGAILIVVE